MNNNNYFLLTIKTKQTITQPITIHKGDAVRIAANDFAGPTVVFYLW